MQQSAGRQAILTRHFIRTLGQPAFSFSSKCFILSREAATLECYMIARQVVNSWFVPAWDQIVQLSQLETIMLPLDYWGDSSIKEGSNSHYTASIPATQIHMTTILIFISQGLLFS